MNSDDKNITVPATIPDSETVVTEVEVIEELERSGRIKVPKQWLTGLNKIGVYVKGGIAAQRGTLMVTQAQLATLMQDAMEAAAKIAGDTHIKSASRTTLLERLSRSMSMLARAQIEAVRAQIELEEKVKVPMAPLEEEPIRTQAFETGKPVVLALQTAGDVHIHGPK